MSLDVSPVASRREPAGGRLSGDRGVDRPRPSGHSTLHAFDEAVGDLERLEHRLALRDMRGYGTVDVEGNQHVPPSAEGMAFRIEGRMARDGVSPEMDRAERLFPARRHIHLDVDGGDGGEPGHVSQGSRRPLLDGVERSPVAAAARTTDRVPAKVWPAPSTQPPQLRPDDHPASGQRVAGTNRRPLSSLKVSEGLGMSLSVCVDGDRQRCVDIFSVILFNLKTFNSTPSWRGCSRPRGRPTSWRVWKRKSSQGPRPT